WFPLLVLGPPVARALARDGWTKDDLKQYLYKNSKVAAYFVETMPVMSGTPYNLRRLVEEGRLPKEYYESSDPTRLVPVFLRPEWIEIVVAGDPGVARMRGYTNNHEQGVPVSKSVRLPARWKELIGRARSTA
ncbi:MAG: hypothetical protein Q7O66_13950, partial [Dehalococcoidia bacterium]|nr:hypothetical protein [Dehalococcoidia bacterium]